MTVVCKNEEYDELDEYVYSARKAAGYEYNDKLIFGIQPGCATKLKIALKVAAIHFHPFSIGTE